MMQQGEVGEEITTIEWGVVLDEGLGPEVIVPPFANDKERVERFLKGIREGGGDAAAAQLVVRTTVVSAWTRLRE